jgi:hypothetical protein
MYEQARAAGENGQGKSFSVGYNHLAGSADYSVLCL